MSEQSNFPYASQIEEVKNTIRLAIHGKDEIIDMVLCAAFAGGHILLEDIPGVGPKRRRALMAAYESVDDIKNASAEEIADKTGIPLNTAEEIYKYFHPSL